MYTVQGMDTVESSRKGLRAFHSGVVHSWSCLDHALQRRSVAGESQANSFTMRPSRRSERHGKLKYDAHRVGLTSRGRNSINMLAPRNRLADTKMGLSEKVTLV